MSRRRALALHLLGAFVLAGGFAAAVGSTLFATVSNLMTTATTPESQRGIPVPVPLGGLAAARTAYEARWQASDPFAVLSHHEIRIPVGTGGERLRVAEAALQIGETGCTYAAKPGDRLSDTEPLVLVQGMRCNPLDGMPTPDLHLTVRLAGAPHALSVIAALPVAPSPAAAAAVPGIRIPGGLQGQPAVLFADYGDDAGPPHTRRIDLLNYMWQISPSPHWLYEVLGGAALMLFLGLLLMPAGPVTAPGVSRWVFSLRSGAGAGLVAGALALSYAVIVPPFQAADEPYQFLGFAEVANRDGLWDQAKTWSAIIHFDRLAGHAEQRFRPADMARRGQEWSKVTTQSVVFRSANTRLWGLFGSRFPHLPAAATLAALRMLNAAIWTLTIAVCAAAAAAVTDAAWPQFLLFPFLFVPTIPYFATYVSNYATLTSAYTLLAFAVVACIVDGRHSEYCGALLGLGLGTAVVLSRSAAPMIGLVAFVAVGRILVRSVFPCEQRPVWQTAVFWSGLALAPILAAWLADPRYLQLFAQAPTGAGGMAPGAATSIAPGCAFATAAIAVGCAWEIFSRPGRLWRGRLLGVARFCLKIAAVLVAGTMIVSLVIQPPSLGFIDSLNPPSVSRYVANALASGVFFFRLRHPDPLLSVTFWAGFGWLDVAWPAWMVTGMTLLAGCSLTALLWFALRTSARAQPAIALFLMGSAVTFAVYAMVALRIVTNLHGRYLIGLYLAGLSVCWSWFAIAPARRDAAAKLRPLALAALVIFTNGVSLALIARRYF